MMTDKQAELPDIGTDPLGHHLIALERLGYTTQVLVRLEKQSIPDEVIEKVEAALGFYADACFGASHASDAAHLTRHQYDAGWAAREALALLQDYRSIAVAVLDPDMPTQELRLHMGELTANEVLVARAAIRWANSRVKP